jgi:hypothetical protein
MESRHLTIPCAQCGRATDEFALLPDTPEGTQMWHAKDRLERTDFMGAVIKFGDYARLQELFDSLARADYSAARTVDVDLIAFYCDDCGKPYCEACWNIGGPEFDEGFYDCTHGACPLGHEQIVDD